jgi:Na+-driven multidrug efflux pump
MDHVLIAAGFDPKMSELACEMVTYMLPALFLQTYNEMIRNYLMSQKVTKPFVFINLVTLSFFPVGGYFIIYKSGWGVPGFGLFKFIVEFMNMIGLTILMKKYGHEESIKREKVTESLNRKEFAQYMRDFGKILMGWYASYFGLEVNTILCGITKNTVTMACWGSYMNVFAIAWTIGSGLAITTRTNSGMNVGAQKFNTAKKYGAMGLVLAMCYSAVAGTLVMVFCAQIAHMFSEVPQVLKVLPHVIFCMGMLIILIGSGP